MGDIHKTNQILDTEGRVRYCGSTVQQNFGETNDKGFLIWEIEDKKFWQTANREHSKYTEMILKKCNSYLSLEVNLPSFYSASYYY